MAKNINSVTYEDVYNKMNVVAEECDSFQALYSVRASRENPEEYVLYSLSDFSKQRERVKVSVENAYGSILYLLQMGVTYEVKQALIKYLETLFDVSERLSFSCVGSGYNVMFDIFHTLKLIQLYPYRKSSDIINRLRSSVSSMN